MPTFTPLAPSARLLFHMQSFSRLLLFWVPVSVLGGFGVATLWGPLVGLSAAFALLFVRFLLALWWPWLAWARWGYHQRSEELLIRRGVLIRSVTAIPLERIQHVDVRQGPLEMWFDLARVHIHTASGLGGDGIVPGLVRADAEALRDDLVRAAAGGDDGV